MSRQEAPSKQADGRVCSPPSRFAAGGTLEKGLPPGATDPADVLLHATAGRALPAAGLAAYGAKLKTLPGVGAADPELLAGGVAGRDADAILPDPRSAGARASQ